MLSKEALKTIRACNEIAAKRLEIETLANKKQKINMYTKIFSDIQELIYMVGREMGGLQAELEAEKEDKK